VAQRRVFLDTSFVIALATKDDPHHQRAKALDNELLADGALLTFHWGVLIEIADGFARIGRRQSGLHLLAKFTSETGYEIVPISDSLLQDGLNLYGSRPDKEWGLTDCISFVTMTKLGITDALTADLHFRQAGFNALLLDPE
jgi:uncharacterized protein